MVKFLDGPAAGECLALRRAPSLLRVVKGPREWDALDQLNDVPKRNERVYAYRLKGKALPVRLNARGCCGWYQLADYIYEADQPADAVMRDTVKWREWCQGMKERDAVPPVPTSLFEEERVRHA